MRTSLPTPVILVLLTSVPAVSQQARIDIITADRADAPVSRYLYGKFTEHLWWNVYNGLWSQVLKNPGFESWELLGKSPGRVDDWFRRGDFLGKFPHLKLDDVKRPDIAPWWLPYGTAGATYALETSALNSVHCQRITATSVDGGAGIEQPLFLPLHREHTYELSLFARGDALLRVSIHASNKELAAAEIQQPGRDWGRHSFALKMDRTGVENGMPLLIRIELLTPGTVSLDQLFLFPKDNLDGFDPDIVSMLEESRLPLLRFPGGNFVSGYHWEDGIGDVNSRPTRTNPAWGGFEPNHVGTDEYIKLCRRIGAEPLICINAGNGTAREAANWVEYCNGSTDTRYGALRAKHGSPEPYNIKHWEIGNELYGKWQVGYCTPEEYAARYAEFHKAMSAVDPTIQFQAIGQSEEWIAPLLASNPGIIRTLAVHELPGGGTPADAPPAEVFEELMANIETFRTKLLGLAARMRDAGLTPKLTITEAQIFTNKRTLPTNDSLAEALFLSGLIHMAVREGDLIEMITHSALVNHGGGLRKQKEFAYATPVHYASVLYGTQSGRYPVGVKLRSPEYESPGRYLKRTRGQTISLLDPIALLDEAGEELTLIVANRSPDTDTTAEISLADYPALRSVRTRTLAGESFMARNSLDTPELVSLASGATEQSDGRLSYEFPAHSLVELVFVGQNPQPARANQRRDPPR